MHKSHPTQEARQDPVALATGSPLTDLSNAPQSRNDDAPPRLVKISARAYELYEARGAAEGNDLDDWLQAEREIDAKEGS